MEMEMMLVIEIILMFGKIVFWMIVGLVILLAIFAGTVFYFMCTSEDNCTACPGALNGSCETCRIHKNKLKREKKQKDGGK